MNDKMISQGDWSARKAEIALRQKFYSYDLSTGIPLSKFPDLMREKTGSDWIRQVLSTLLRLRGNMKTYMKQTPFSFENAFPPDISNPEIIRFALSGIATDRDSALQNLIDTASNVSEIFLPDLGPGGNVSSVQEYRDLFHSMPLPEIADRFETDASFAHNFIAGPNPGVIKRMNAVSSAFPISNREFQSVPAFASDDLQTAIAEGRVFWVDHSKLQVLKNGRHYNERSKYTYAPFAAFAVPREGGALQPFAIQCGPRPEGRLIYTPRDGYSWKIAKNCVLVAHNIHHELSTHLGLTHYLMEPILMATRRNLGLKHPVYVLLNHHFEGTMLINFGARTNLVQPTRAVDRLLGCELPSAYEFVKNERLNYSFTGNYLPNRFIANQTESATSAIRDYPYRDDASLIWDSISIWMKDFVANYYASDSDVASDSELQAWAAEISSPRGGMVKDFGATPGRVLSRQDLASILTMTLFTAGPQHAAVNFAQLTDMSFVAANPLAGFTPEPRGLGHTEQDWLNNLPPIECAIHGINILTLLGSVNYSRLGEYAGPAMDAIKSFESGQIADAVKNFQADLASIEQIIERRNEKRYRPYVHLLPSRIPQSVNI